MPHYPWGGSSNQLSFIVEIFCLGLFFNCGFAWIFSGHWITVDVDLPHTDMHLDSFPHHHNVPSPFTPHPILQKHPHRGKRTQWLLLLIIIIMKQMYTWMNSQHLQNHARMKLSEQVYREQYLFMTFWFCWPLAVPHRSYAVLLDRENKGAGGVSGRERGGHAAQKLGWTECLCGPNAPER